MKTRRILLISLFALTQGSCGSSQTVVQDSPSPAPADTNMVSPITPEATTIATPTVIETGTGRTYHNTQAGYSAEYPADWAVNESVGLNGELMTTFTAPDQGQAIAVSVVNSETAVDEIPDMPNTRCQQVTIGGVSGRRCFDTFASSIATTFFDQGRQYTIASSGKHPDQNIYQRFLESFTVTP